MSTIITKDYFKGDLLIPNLGTGTVPGQAVTSAVERYISIYESEYLSQLLGETLHEAFVEGLKAEEIDQKWKDLRSQLVDDTLYLSPIADYIWWFWYKDDVVKKTGQGDAEVKGANAIIICNGRRMCDVWNRMVRKSEVVYDYILDNDEDFGAYELPVFDFTTINSMGI